MNEKTILPPKTIGIIGGGQLGRMMAIAARYMGYRIIVLDPTPDCPCAQVADEQIVKHYDDMQGIRTLTEKSDVVTYEFENVDLTAAKYIEEKGKLPQGAYPLEVTQNREKEKNLMTEAGLPVPEFYIVHNKQECLEACEKIAYPAVIKTCRGGYDGKGQVKLETAEDTEEAAEFVEKHGHCIIESWVPFDREVSVVFTRTRNGNGNAKMAFFPIPENEHKDHILYKSTVPANISVEVQKKAQEAARLLADKMDIVGTFAIEMFVVNEAIYVNEMAPRPHNSGHYTIEACNISQFEQHIRAVAGLPLMPIQLMAPAVMKNILGEDVEDTLKEMAVSTSGHVHFYGKKEIKTKRKMGHITYTGEVLAKTETSFLDANAR